MTLYPTIFRKYTSSDPISLKISTIAHFDDVKNVGIVLIFFMRTFIVKMNNRANFYENRFGGSVFSEKRWIWRHFMTSYPTIFRKYISSYPIYLKIGTITHFDDTSSQKKIQNDSDIFDVVMTSSFFADDVISDDFDDVIAT